LGSGHTLWHQALFIVVLCTCIPAFAYFLGTGFYNAGLWLRHRLKAHGYRHTSSRLRNGNVALPARSPGTRPKRPFRFGTTLAILVGVAIAGFAILGVIVQLDQPGAARGIAPGTSYVYLGFAQIVDCILAEHDMSTGFAQTS
jgi:hypothetical protein